MSVTYQIPGLSPQQWPIETSDRKHIIEFYGPMSEVERNLTAVIIPWKCNITHLQVHRICAESSQRIYNAFWERIGHDQAFVNAHHLNQCDGSYNPRPNANQPDIWSLHSWACAQDWAAAWNPNGRKWTGAPGEIPIEFAECFLAEGATWLSGKYGTADSMHFQFTKNSHPDAPAATGELPTLKLGDKDPLVIQLQQKLGVPATGVFDGATDTAVRQRQAAAGMFVDGVVGAKTWAILGSVTPPALPPVIITQPPPVIVPPTPPIITAPGPTGPTPFDPVLQDIWRIIVDKSGLQAEFDAKKAIWEARYEAIAAESLALARDIHDWQPTALLGGPVVVTPVPPTPPVLIPPPIQVPPQQIPPPPQQIPAPPQQTELSPATIDAIAALVASSPVAGHSWAGRGVAPIGYIKGVATTFGLVCQKYAAGDSAARVMAQANTRDDGKDALSWYNSNFNALGMTNDAAGPDTLRHLFILLLGLGMRESSGNCLEGHDTTVSNPTANSAEAGLFQQSYDSFGTSPELPKLMAAYMAHPEWGYQKIFLDGVTSGMTSNVGSGPGAEFQRLCKISPAFAVEAAAVGLRTIRQHWGPINRKEAELLLAADDLFTQVQKIIDQQESKVAVSTPNAIINSPKTSVAGAGAIVAAGVALYTMYKSGTIDVASATTNIGIIFAGIVGLFSKDFNVTGGTKHQ